MVAGMLPIAPGLTGDSSWRAPMGIVAIGGLILSTMLTLVIVPAGFTLADDLERWLGPHLKRNLHNSETNLEGAGPAPADWKLPHGPAKLRGGAGWEEEGKAGK